MFPILLLTLFFGVFLMLAKVVRSQATAELNEHRKTRARCGLSGAEIARRILDTGGARSVSVVAVEPGEPNRYLPRTKKLELDHNIFHSRSLTAVAVAARTATQGLQQLEKYPPYLWRREVLRLSRAAVLIALLASATLMAARFASARLLTVGVILGWTSLVILNLSTLAVEWNANQRALKLLSLERLIERDGAEREQLAQLLRSAAWYETAAMLDAFKSPFAPLQRLFRRSAQG